MESRFHRTFGKSTRASSIGWTFVVRLLTAGVATALVLVVALAFVACGGHEDTVSVPSVVGLSENVAVKRVDHAGLRAGVTRRRSSTGTDSVVRQEPTGGTEVKLGTRIELLIEVKS
jgi:beta-lactam-binding protein with PASTA domain